uniref:hypothetical protein n=1 Tax=Herbidospora sakaeratensis TaxID=564415 RepID=UPI0012F7E6D7|nr:hypothetical protein [Herbidospora sakaeratensis]
MLHLGDAILARHSSGQTYAHAAQALGVTPDQAKKAARLARVFGPELRDRIGHDALGSLTAAHLDAVVKHPDANVRVELALGAHADGTSSRELQATLSLLMGVAGATSFRSEYNMRTDFDSAAEAAEILVRRGERGLGSYVGGRQGKGLVRLCIAMKTLIPLIDALGISTE